MLEGNFKQERLGENKPDMRLFTQLFVLFLTNKSTPGFIHLFENAGSAKKKEENYVLELKKNQNAQTQRVTVGF